RLAEVNLRLEVRARVGVRQGFLELDAVLLVEVVQRDVEALNPALTAGGNRLLDPYHVALLDEFLNVRRVDHHLNRRHTAAVAAHDEALSHDGAQVLREVQEDLVVLLAREHVDDAIERLSAIVRVQRRENQVSGSGQVNGRLHTLPIPDLTDEN